MVRSTLSIRVKWLGLSGWPEPVRATGSQAARATTASATGSAESERPVSTARGSLKRSSATAVSASVLGGTTVSTGRAATARTGVLAAITIDRWYEGSSQAL